jgi:hypothetical protein
MSSSTDSNDAAMRRQEERRLTPGRAHRVRAGRSFHKKDRAIGFASTGIKAPSVAGFGEGVAKACVRLFATRHDALPSAEEGDTA